MFRDLDKDGNGFIDESELVTALRRLGLNPSLKEIQSMIDEVDSDGNEIIFLSLKTSISARNIITNLNQYLLEVGIF